MRSVSLKTNSNYLEINETTPIRINCNIGINSLSQYNYELKRLNAIETSNLIPDLFMDLSTVEINKPLYTHIIDCLNVPVGTVPSYLLHTITRSKSPLDILKKQADSGISFFTLHLTAEKSLYQKAIELRKIPCTSRGGKIVLQYEEDNIWVRNLENIINLAKQYKITISIGTTFRPASIFEACDEIHIAETKRQLEFCKILQDEGVDVIVENIGHIDIKKIVEHSKLLSEFNAPIMPLGPIPTDNAIGQDHIASAIGAAFLGYYGCVQIINCITRSEHCSSYFSIEETLEAIQTAKTAAHIIDISRGININEDRKIYNSRSQRKSCLANSSKCTRCSDFCPLK